MTWTEGSTPEHLIVSLGGTVLDVRLTSLIQAQEALDPLRQLLLS